ncbi:amastin-like protein [Leishmania braziliensis MHOM/BR/75/M2904]|uniref:Amastin-like protein n=2 Tax=Leishmania braziliensis TaxID=5660 RepID=A4H5D2_LEIBR|nr:amastin-like protein [Leishmania braziliensis MHOM/BR/75/M2904]CAJ2476540.1 unnamed protein product [Leishmania braziliensis]CAJ2476544.1 unnamed protein product [Leishmania braziliensis]CAM37156.1 amastin-like protein [Leishmania braziliensis MHOM/BR/75/M2904]SYZ67664.1 Amastin_surface_glycoprotein [Leishmania braziliensis MHOM/BR/75/M2904]
MECGVGVLVYAILQFIAFMFLLSGSLVDMFHVNEYFSANSDYCLTYWGLKERCTDMKNVKSLDEFFKHCSFARDHFHTARVLALVSIVVFGLASLLGFMTMCCYNSLGWGCLLLNIVGIVTSAFSWAPMVVLSRYDNLTFCTELPVTFAFGSGFALLIVAWILDIINIFFLLFPCQSNGSDKNLYVT